MILRPSHGFQTMAWLSDNGMAVKPVQSPCRHAVSIARVLLSIFEKKKCIFVGKICIFWGIAVWTQWGRCVGASPRRLEEARCRDLSRKHAFYNSNENAHFREAEGGAHFSWLSARKKDLRESRKNAPEAAERRVFGRRPPKPVPLAAGRERASPRAGAGGAAAGAGGVSETRPRHAFDCCEVYNVSFKPSDAPELAAIICNEVYDEVFKAASC